MTSSSNIAAKFEAAIEAFTPIVGQPKNISQFSSPARNLEKSPALSFLTLHTRINPGWRSCLTRTTSPLTSTTHRSCKIPKRGSNESSRRFVTLASKTKTASEPQSMDAVFSSCTLSRKCTTSPSATKTPTTKWCLRSSSSPVSPKKLGAMKEPTSSP